MTPAAPRLSVIIPVYNGERFIRQALQSTLSQDHPPAEIIVVDDGSNDGTADIVTSVPGVRLIRQANQGPGSARNRGLGASRGDLICFLDADDRWTADKTSVQLPLLAQDAGLDIVIGYSQRTIVERWEGLTPIFALISDPVFYLHLGSAIIRRHVFDKVGLFDEELALIPAHRATAAVGEEIDWYLRAKELGVRMRFHPEVVMYYLKHDRNVTRGRDLADQYLVRMFKRSLDRRRGSTSGVAPALPDWAEECRLLRRRQ